MSSDSERNNLQFQVFSQPPVYVPQSNAVPSAVFYYPQAAGKQIESSTAADEALARNLQAQENAAAVPQVAPQQENQGGCRRWGGWRSRRCGRNWQNVDSQGGCGWKDDGRQLGNLTNFMQGLVFGAVAPILSLIGVFGFETSKLTRTGALFGNANFFLLFAAGLVSSVIRHGLNPHIKLYALIPLFLGIIFVMVSKCSFRRFLYVYRTRTNKTESEEVKVVSEAGKCCSFLTGFLASLFFSLLGASIVLIARRRNLRARFGAFAGLGVSLIIGGVVLLFVKGIPPVLIGMGLFLIQISAVHFKRAIASALAKEGNTSSC